MVKLIIGVKGTGKTKTLIEMVHTALDHSKGKVVCIEKSNKLRYDINYRCRLVEADEYFVDDAQSLYGFVAGMVASDHDITDLFIDSGLKIANDDMDAFVKLIKELDVPKKLVEIGVTVVELTREDALDWQLSFAAEAANDDKVQGAVGQNARNLFDRASLAGKGLAGAATYLGEDVNVSASLSALREKGKARSISRTSLLTLDNLAAQLTDTQSYHARVVGTEVASLEEVSAGTKLQIKPRIVKSADTNAPDRVWLTMELQDGGFESVTVDAMPMTRTSTLETQASVQENHSILLAGYMRDIKESAGWGIPYLRDIPWIGWLFGGASYRDETVQRLFILTPYIVDADGPDAVRGQAARQRDTMLEESLESDKEVDDIERKERNEQIEEQQEIREDAAKERHHRNSEEREFRREKRKDAQEADRKAWQDGFEARKAKYEEEKEKASAK